MQKIFMFLLLLSVMTACKPDEGVPEEPESTMMDLDLSDVNSIIGRWGIYDLLYGGDISPTVEETWEIKDDGTMTRCVYPYTFNATYTYSDGILNYSCISYTTDLRTYKFSHYDDKYLKVEYYWYEGQTSPIIQMAKKIK